MIAARRRLAHLGARCACPICRSPIRAFADFNGRPSARCPVCDSLERHRHLWLYLKHRTELLRAPASLLHVAPDPSIDARLAGVRTLRYISGDIDGRRGTRRLDLTDLDLPDAGLDAVIAYHVLEHIGDDARALSEIRRVLRPGGFALLQVPIQPGPTVEDPAVTDPAERLRRFGQHDHVRIYGEDFPDRLARAGLDGKLETFRDELTPAHRMRYGLVSSDVRFWQLWRAGALPARAPESV